MKAFTNIFMRNIRDISMAVRLRTTSFNVQMRISEFFNVLDHSPLNEADHVRAS